MEAKGKRRRGRKLETELSVSSCQLSAKGQSAEHGARSTRRGWLQSPDSGLRSAPAGRQSPIPPLIFEGDLFSHDSLAHVNRELLLELTKRGVRAGVVPSEDREFAPEADPRYAALVPLVNDIPSGVGTLIRHRCPPDLRRPTGHKFVLVQPWEYGYLPSPWVEAIQTDVDQAWVYSRYLRDVYIRSGVPAEKVFVVPLGVAPEVFCPEGDQMELQTEKGCRFLFVGAAEARTGLDLLLEAYCEEFSPADDVALIIKDSASCQAASCQLDARLGSVVPSGRTPEIIHIPGDLPPSEMPNLYRSVDAVVFPYRAEGFCLSAIEAMACGKPAILTGFGPSLDYASSEQAYMLPYTPRKPSDSSTSAWETAWAAFWAEPDKEALKAAMRSVFTDRDEARRRGKAAAEFIRANFTWERTADTVCIRLAALSQQIRGDTPAQAAA